MNPHHVYYQLVILALLWLCIMLPHLWPRPPGRTPPTPTPPIRAKRRRASEPTPCAGLTHKPPCPLCEQEPSDIAPAPPGRPDPLPPTHRRPRTVDTSMHFCPHPECDYRGWRGLNNLRAKGLPTICQAELVTFFAPSPRPAYNEFGWHPSGGPWRQFYCRGCSGFFPEHHGTIFHGKQAEVELIVRVLT